MKYISILGSTGSIGRQTLEVISCNKDKFTVVALVANSNIKLLEEQIIASGNYATLFITLTLPSKFHKYSQQTKKYNPLYNEQCTINEGYNLLNKAKISNKTPV